MSIKLLFDVSGNLALATKEPPLNFENDYIVIEQEDFNPNCTYRLIDGELIIEENTVINDQLETEWKKTEYRRLRELEYPDISDLADALYWNSKGDSSKLELYYEQCELVKIKYPKPQ